MYAVDEDGRCRCLHFRRNGLIMQTRTGRRVLSLAEMRISRGLREEGKDGNLRFDLALRRDHFHVVLSTGRQVYSYSAERQES